jgi:hypothetical protein
MKTLLTRVAGWLLVPLIVVGSVVLMMTWRAEVSQLKADLYERCQEREGYDAASQEARRVARDYWIAYIAAEQTNAFINDELRRQRINNAQRMVDSLDAVLVRTVSPGCDRYAP